MSLVLEGCLICRLPYVLKYMVLGTLTLDEVVAHLWQFYADV